MKPQVLYELGADWYRTRFDVDYEPATAAEATALLQERQAARKAKNFARADEIRDALKEMGFVVEDTANGPKLKKI